MRFRLALSEKTAKTYRISGLISNGSHNGDEDVLLDGERARVEPHGEASSADRDVGQDLRQKATEEQGGDLDEVDAGEIGVSFSLKAECGPKITCIRRLDIRDVSVDTLRSLEKGKSLTGGTEEA